MTQPLSPAAQAICDALDVGHLNGPQQLVALVTANLVLRTAAIEIFPEERPPYAAMLEWLEKHPEDLPPWQSRAANRKQLLAIATELHTLATQQKFFLHTLATQQEES